MVYIRTKKIKGDKYLYLVKSIWDPKRSTSKQEIVKYLGKASQVTPEDIPVDYRNDPKIQSFLSVHSGKNVEEVERLNKKLKLNLFNALTKGDLDKSLDIYENYTRYGNLKNFFEDILKPVMHHVGDLWETSKLSVATEHVASNIANELISVINEKTSKLDHKGKVLVCTPSGEEHSLGCSMLQTFLQSKGFRVFNLSPSQPTESILNFIENEKPSIVLVSITLEDNIKSGQRLVNKINSNYDLPVLVGGQAIENDGHAFHATLVKKESIGNIPKLIKQLSH